MYSPKAEINTAMKTKVKGLGMVDSIILATAQTANAKVLTEDRCLKGIKQTIPIG